MRYISPFFNSLKIRKIIVKFDQLLLTRLMSGRTWEDLGSFMPTWGPLWQIPRSHGLLEQVI